MREEKINDVLDGCALLEYLGDLYEYTGSSNNGKHIFQCVSDDSHVIFSYQELLTSPYIHVQY